MRPKNEGRRLCAPEKWLLRPHNRQRKRPLVDAPPCRAPPLDARDRLPSATGGRSNAASNNRRGLTSLSQQDVSCFKNVKKVRREENVHLSLHRQILTTSRMTASDATYKLHTSEITKFNKRIANQRKKIHKQSARFVDQNHFLTHLILRALAPPSYSCARRTHQRHAAAVAG